MKKCVHIIVSGNVQGVFYRVNTKKKAEELGLAGWVKNTLNNKVEVLAEGEEGDLKELIEWCYNGSKNAVVKNIEVKWGSFENKFDLFEILL